MEVCVMVNVFIVHSGNDYDYVKDSVEPFLMGKIDEDGKKIDAKCNANILTLKSGKKDKKTDENNKAQKKSDDKKTGDEKTVKDKNRHWKIDANKKIRMAQVVVVIIGQDASEPSKNDTMGWEVKRAIKYNKQIMVHNRGENKIPKYLYNIDRFSKLEQLIAPQQTLFEIKKRIDDYSEGYYNIYSKKYESLSKEEKSSRKNELIDQYKMFQKSSEDLVSRRQNVNSFYISVNSAIVALTGIVIGMIDMPAKLLIVLFMCLCGAILDISWINILESYGNLNAAKMKVICLMEKDLPVELYDVEWQVMSDKLNNKKYVSFTNSEKRIPKIFLAVYILSIILISVLLFI